MRDIEDDANFRRDICDWLTANGIDPNRTPIHADATLADGQLTIRQKVQRSNGADVLLPGAFEILTETVTVPVVVPPTGDVAEWLRPKCPTCGR